MKSIKKVLLSPRGRTHREVLALGAYVATFGEQAGSPYAWVVIDPREKRMQAIEFLFIQEDDIVTHDGFNVHSAFKDSHTGELYFGLIHYGPIIPDAHS